MFSEIKRFIVLHIYFSSWIEFKIWVHKINTLELTWFWIIASVALNGLPFYCLWCYFLQLNTQFLNLQTNRPIICSKLRYKYLICSNYG